MKFIKKHFEKVIFIFLLLAFVILFGLQAFSVISQQDEKPEEKLKINLGRMDYTPLNIESDEFRVFDKTEERFETNPRVSSVLKFDLLVPPVLAKCPFGAHMISRDIFPKEKGQTPVKKCPLCKTALEDVPLEEAAQAAVDTDGDGIPDADEIRNGLNPKNKEDALADKDEDGFTNLDEILAGTRIDSAASRPGYEKKLYVVKVKQSAIGIQLQQIKTVKNGGTADWKLRFQFQQKDKRGKMKKRQSKDLKVGDVLENAGYLSDNFTVQEIKEASTSVGKKYPERDAIIYLKRERDGAIVSMKYGIWATDPKKEVTFRIDLPFMTEKEIKTRVGEEFSIGNEKIGIDKLKVISAENDSQQKSVKVENTTKGSTTEVPWLEDSGFSEENAEIWTPGGKKPNYDMKKNR